MAKTIALLDVDSTLLGDTTIAGRRPINWALIHGLRDAGITDVHLFTAMPCTGRAILERDELIGTMQKSGLNVHKVITPSDLLLGIDKTVILDFYAEIKKEFPSKNTKEVLDSIDFFEKVKKIIDSDPKFKILENFENSSSNSSSNLATGQSYEIAGKRIGLNINYYAQYYSSNRTNQTKEDKEASQTNSVISILSKYKKYEHAKIPLFKKFLSEKKEDTNIVICDDLKEVLQGIENVPSEQTRVSTIHVRAPKPNQKFKDKTQEKYQFLFSLNDYKKYGGQIPRSFQKVENAFKSYFENTQNYYNKNIVGRLSKFFNKDRASARIDASRKLSQCFTAYKENKTEENKKALVDEIVNDFQQFKPRVLGSYSQSFQYKILLALYKVPELKKEVQERLPKPELDQAWKRFNESHSSLRHIPRANRF